MLLGSSEGVHRAGAWGLGAAGTGWAPQKSSEQLLAVVFYPLSKRKHAGAEPAWYGGMTAGIQSTWRPQKPELHHKPSMEGMGAPGEHQPQHRVLQTTAINLGGTGEGEINASVQQARILLSFFLLFSPIFYLFFWGG